MPRHSRTARRSVALVVSLLTIAGAVFALAAPAAAAGVSTHYQVAVDAIDPDGWHHAIDPDGWHNNTPLPFGSG